MSFRLAGRAWEQEIPSPLKLVLLALADTANDDGLCWPGRKHLAKKCGLGLRTLDAHLNSLIDLGLLAKTTQKRQNGSYASSLYQIFPSASGGSADPALPLAQILRYPSARSAQGSADPAPLEPIKEPATEPTTTTKTTEPGNGGGDSANSGTQTPKPGTEGIDDPKSPFAIDEYIRLGRMFGGKGGLPPSNPPAWEVAARRRIKEQGGLSQIDLEQLKAWKIREQRQKETLQKKETEREEEKQRQEHASRAASQKEREKWQNRFAELQASL